MPSDKNRIKGQTKKQNYYESIVKKGICYFRICGTILLI